MTNLSDPESEEMLASWVLIDPKKFDSCPIPPTIFSDESLQRVVILAVSLRFSGNPITPEAIGVETGDDALKIKAAQLISRGLPSVPADKLIARLSGLALKRSIGEISHDFHLKAHDDELEGLDLVSELEARVLEVRQHQSTSMAPGADVSELRALFEWRLANPKTVRGLRFNMPKLELMIDGLRGGQVIVVAARPSVGKSGFMATILTNLMGNSIPSAVFSFEMSGLSIQERILSIKSGVQMGVTKRRAYHDGEVDAITKALAWMETRNWMIEDNATLDFPEVINAMRRDHHTRGTRVFAIDYIQLMRYKKFAKAGRRIEIGEISAGLKRFAKEINGTIFELAQLRRGEGYFDRTLKRTVMPKPKIEDLKESGAIEEDADTVLLIDRDQVNNSPDVNILVAKGRDHETGQVDFSYDPKITRFEEC